MSIAVLILFDSALSLVIHNLFTLSLEDKEKQKTKAMSSILVEIIYWYIFKLKKLNIRSMPEREASK